MSRRGFAGIWSAVGLSVLLGLTGCSQPVDQLAADYREGIGQNYISGDGAYVFIEPGSRGESVTFSGELDMGGVFDSADYAGQPMLVNFWYAGCPPCRLEAEDLQQLNETFSPEGMAFVGINIYDQQATSLTFAEEFGITYPSILDAGSGLARLSFAGEITPNAVPTTLILDSDHRVAARVSGLITDIPLLERMIQDVLSEAGS
jgi:thiol-disulfide isomerase/thioredoxin